MVCREEFPKYVYCISSSKEVYSFVIGDQSRCENGWPVYEKEKLALFSATDISTPRIVPLLTNIISVAIGYTHVICLDRNGTVFSFGYDFGWEDLESIFSDNLKILSRPQRINITPICQISCGDSFTICLSEENELYSFGDNYYGQLGLGNNESYNSPQLISSLKEVEFVECGGSHVFCKTLNNEIYSWGNNYDDRLGRGDRKARNAPRLCPYLSEIDVVDVKCGKKHTLVLTSNQIVYSFGNNDYGQLGRETNSSYQIEGLSDIVRIECGHNHSLCIDINGDLYVFGDNEENRLGLGEQRKIERPTKHFLSNIIDISSRGKNVFVKTNANEIFTLQTESNQDFTPIQLFQDNEDIWCTNRFSRAKSARK